MVKNKKNIAVFLGAVFSIVFSVFVFSGNVTYAADSLINPGDTTPIVPCATSTNDRACKLCDLIVGIKNIIDWGKNILVVVALVVITVGGLMYSMSSGNEQMMEMSKNIIMQALWGVIIVLGAWLIINLSMRLLSVGNSDLGITATSWSKFDCNSNSSGGGGASSSYDNDNNSGNGGDSSVDTWENEDNDGDGIPNSSDDCPNDSSNSCSDYSDADNDANNLGNSDNDNENFPIENDLPQDETVIEDPQCPPLDNASNCNACSVGSTTVCMLTGSIETGMTCSWSCAQEGEGNQMVDCSISVPAGIIIGC